MRGGRLRCCLFLAVLSACSGKSDQGTRNDAGTSKVPVTEPKTQAKEPSSQGEATKARDEWAAANKLDIDFTNSIGMKFTLIPPGKFKMGSPESELAYGKHNEDEFQHEVEINQPFYYLGVYEVTQQEFEKVVGENPAYFCSQGNGRDMVAGMETGQFPVDQVSWEDVQAFLKALNIQEQDTSRRYRLPTEAEWEYACRAGTETPFSFGSCLNGNEANCDGRTPYGETSRGRALPRTAQVGSYAENQFGLYDMHGNVREWNQDYYGPDYYYNSPIADPSGPATGTARVIRGGSWLDSAVSCRSAARLGVDPSERFYAIGFRVLCEIDPPLE